MPGMHKKALSWPFRINYLIPPFFYATAPILEVSMKEKQTIIKLLLIISLVLVSTIFISIQSASAKDLEVIYPPRESANDVRDDDLVEILKTALEKTIPTDGPYSMRPSIEMNEGRFREELRTGVLINIIWSVATLEAEKNFLSVKIPLRKGILGYRVFLIRKQDKDKFAAVKNLEDLKKFSVGQGHTWNDLAVFKANGIDTVTGNDYERLFGVASWFKRRFAGITDRGEQRNRSWQNWKSVDVPIELAHSLHDESKPAAVNG